MGAGKGQVRRTQGQISRQLRDSYLSQQRELLDGIGALTLANTAADKGGGESERFVVHAAHRSFGAYDTEEDEVIQYFPPLQYGSHSAASAAAEQFVREANARDHVRKWEAASKAEKKRKMEESANSIKRVDF